MNDDYKTEREIELEKEIAKGDKIIGELFREGTEVINKNKELKTKLDIAVKALECYADPYKWDNCIIKFIAYGQQEIVNNGCFTSNGFETAQEALAKIKEIK